MNTADRAIVAAAEERDREWGEETPGGPPWSSDARGQFYFEAGLDRHFLLRIVREQEVDAGHLRDLLALRPSGHTGSLDDRIPWFIHCGISHGANRPDCIVCKALADPVQAQDAADAAAAERATAGRWK